MFASIGGIGTILGVGQAVLSMKGAKDASDAAGRAEELAMEGGALSKAASYANAADAQRLGRMNAGAITGAAANNAQAALQVGEANALAIQKSTIRNLQMKGIENAENLRRMDRQAKWDAGAIRARMGATGISANSGSPLAYLNSEVTESIRQREYERTRGLWALLSQAEEGLQSSLLTLHTAQTNASVIEKNAAMQASVTIAEADMQAAAMMRQGDIMAQVGVANAASARYQGQAAVVSGISSAVNSAAGAFQSWRNATTSATDTPWSSGNSWGSGGAAGPSGYVPGGI